MIPVVAIGLVIHESRQPENARGLLGGGIEVNGEGGVAGKPCVDRLQ